MINDGERDDINTMPSYLASNSRGILVQLVICMSPGHPKIKIANFMKYITFARFLPLNTILWLKNIFGNLKAQLTNILWPINEN